jgi:hypothetical protein
VGDRPVEGQVVSEPPRNGQHVPAPAHESRPEGSREDVAPVKVTKPNKASKPTKPARPTKARTMPSREQFDKLRRLANQGNARAQATLRKILDRHPELWQDVGNLARQAEMSLVGVIAQGEFFVSEAILRQAATLRKDLAGPFPTPLERLAVERVVGAWLELQSGLYS